MKVLVLNGSPRRKGNVSSMLSIVAEEVRKYGHEAIELNVNDMSVRPCTGCMACRGTLRCVLPEDDAQRVLELIRDAGAVVVGTPCYWGNIPGAMKMLFDRIVYGLMGEGRFGIPKPLHKGKRGLVIATSTTPFPFNRLFHQSGGAVRAMREILGTAGFRVGSIQKGGTMHDVTVSPREEARCRRAALRLLR